MFRVKICGVRRQADVEAAAAASADAVGINFHPPSVRFVDNDTAGQLAAAAERLGLTPIGVFVDSATEEIAGTLRATGIRWAQLHGSQTPADARRLSDEGFRVIAAVRLPAEALTEEEIRKRIAPWRPVGCPILLDAEAGSAGGGVGLRLDWNCIGRWASAADRSLQWALAGGLTPDTVAEAIQVSRAPAVDVASGVEEPRGAKSAEKIAAFVAEAARGRSVIAQAGPRRGR